MPETEIKLKNELKNLLDEISFSTKQKREEWNQLIEFMNEQELQEIYDHFSMRKEREQKIKLKLIVKYGLDKTYSKGIGKLSDIFIKKAKDKENKNKQ